MQSTFGTGRFRWLVADTFTMRLRWVSDLKGRFHQTQSLRGFWWVHRLTIRRDLRSLMSYVRSARKKGPQQFCQHLECEAKGKAKKEKAPKQEAEGTARNLKQGCHSHSHSPIIISDTIGEVLCLLPIYIFSKCTSRTTNGRWVFGTSPTDPITSVSISLQRGSRTVYYHDIPEVEKSKQQDRPHGGNDLGPNRWCWEGRISSWTTKSVLVVTGCKGCLCQHAWCSGSCRCK